MPSGKMIMVNPMSVALAGADVNDLPREKWSDAYGVFTPDRSAPFDPENMPLVRAIKGEATERCRNAGPQRRQRARHAC